MSGRKLVRGVLLFTLMLSMAANIGHTVLAVSTVPVGFRMVGAVAWPLLVFFGVEIIVRVAWDAIIGRRRLASLARLLILVPAAPAAITSYEHMHAVLTAMGERPFIAAIGPGAVDVMMIGCTITLVLTRRTTTTLPPALPDEEPALTDEELESVLERWGVSGQESTAAPISPAPMGTPESAPEVSGQERERKVRAPRAGRSEQESAVRMLLDGASVEDVHAATGIGRSTLGRYRTVMRVLHNNPQADEFGSATGKVHSDLIAIIRDRMNRERVR